MKKNIEVSASSVENTYLATDFQVLDGLEAVRLRPGMYIGSNDSAGLQHCLWEILDNSIDEALAGYCHSIKVTIHDDSSIEVQDDGRGIPVDIEPKTQMSGVRVVFEKLHAGGKFGGSNYAVSGGLHGVGAAVVNAVSKRLDVTIHRDGMAYFISFSKGVVGKWDDSGKFFPDESEAPGPTIIGKIAKNITGTTVRYWYDPDIFTEDAAIDIDQLLHRARSSSFLIPKLTIEVIDKRDPNNVVEHRYYYETGLAGMVDEESGGRGLGMMLEFNGSGEFVQKVLGSDVTRQVTVKGALRWVPGYDTSFKSFVNIIATPDGGTHVNGLDKALIKVFSGAYADTRMLKASVGSITKEDIYEGLVGALYVSVPEPLFKGQTKSELATTQVRDIVTKVVTDCLEPIFLDPRNKNKLKPILEKVAEAAFVRVNAKLHKETIRRKNELESSHMPAKLADCVSEDINLNELFIVEGDSAMGTAKKARRAKTQALLPIRGKILNTFRVPEKQMLDNPECAAIITSMGAGSGKSFNVDNRRYGKLILMSDADVDGSHIRCLLLTLAWKYMRPLLESGHVYAAVPPLYSIEVMRSSEPIFAYTEAEQLDIIKKLERSKKTIKTISRFKGLGEMSAEELSATTMNPDNRKLRRITMADAEKALEQFQALMGDEPAARRSFIAERSALAKLEDLDI